MLVPLTFFRWHKEKDLRLKSSVFELFFLAFFLSQKSIFLLEKYRISFLDRIFFYVWDGYVPGLFRFGENPGKKTLCVSVSLCPLASKSPVHIFFYMCGMVYFFFLFC